MLNHLQVVRVILDTPPSCDPNEIAAQTSSILLLVSSEAVERKALIHKSTSGIETLLRCLQVTEDFQVVWNITSILYCLARHKHSGKLAKGGAIPVILSTLSAVSHCSWCTDRLLLLFHSLLSKLSSKDKKFAVKARLSGMLPITTGLLKRCQGQHHDLVTILTVMKKLASNSTNAVSLGTQGCLSVLTKLLTGTGRKDLVVLKYCVEVLVVLLKQSKSAMNVSLMILHPQIRTL